MKQSLELMLYECNYVLKWGIALLVIGLISFILAYIAWKKTDDEMYGFIGSIVVIPLLIAGALMVGCSRYEIRKITMYPEAAYYEHYNRDIDVNVKMDDEGR